MPGESDDVPKYEYRKLQLPMSDLSFASFAKAEFMARRETYVEGQLRASEALHFIPPNPIICYLNESDWDTSIDKKGHFQAKGFNNLFVLGANAGIPRELVIPSLQNGMMTEFGKKIGEEMVRITLQKTKPRNLKIRAQKITGRIRGDVKEVLYGFRAVNEKKISITSPQTGVPVIGNYDVVVIGGGTSGAPAAISAARMGMKVLVVEYLEGLGGIGTLGMIGKPYHGKKVGFAAEVPFPDNNIEPKMEWYRKELEKAGAEIWLGAIGCGAYVEGNMVKGALVATPQGRGVVQAKVVIDATGNADVAISAGAEYRYGTIEQNQIAIQGTGFSSRPLYGNYYNSDYLLVDESDMIDIWRSLVSVQITKKAEDQYDVVPLVQNRERRRVIGDFNLNYLDQLAGRTYPDAIVYSGSDYDSHAYPTSLYFALLPHDEESKKENHPAPGGTCYTPYRCLLPKGFNGILVIGLGISMDRDASAMVRMQFDMSNQGYAAGLAASMAITGDVSLRKINIKELQKKLVEKGNLSEKVLNMEDSFPYPKKEVNKAVLEYGKAANPKSASYPLAVILSHKTKAIPILKKELKRAEGKSKLLYAQVLGICGEKEGVPTMLKELNKFEKWDEKIFQGSMADFAHLPTTIDAVILSLGYSGDKSVLPYLFKMVDKLNTNITLSHHRSLALALENLASPDGAKYLAELLQKPEMQGHAMLNIEDALSELSNDGKGRNPVKNSSMEKRTRALREIILARALYKCGDYNGIGENILKTYTQDMQGLFSQHANLILQNE
jgi:FAD-dependent oxidoreductase family protein